MDKSKKVISLLFLFSFFLFCGKREWVDNKGDDANFLAGEKIPKNSQLYNLSKNNQYKKFRNEIMDSWKNFQGPNLKKIKKWRTENLEVYPDVVLYPFSGPDIINALAFYPNAKKYIMFGLETPGNIPDPSKLNEKELKLAINGLKKSLTSITRWNFFKTLVMEKVIGSHEFNGIVGIIMFMLAKYNCNVLSVNKINYNFLCGCEIVFTLNGDVKVVEYFQVDVCDEAIKSNKFYEYLESYKNFATLLKAASYVMYDSSNPTFKKIRETILKKSYFIIQDDSGIPLRYFKEWKLEFYGIYNKPIPLFAKKYQPELKYLTHKYSKGLLPFSYGYYITPKNCHLMVAKKK